MSKTRSRRTAAKVRRVQRTGSVINIGNDGLHRNRRRKRKRAYDLVVPRRVIREREEKGLPPLTAAVEEQSVAVPASRRVRPRRKKLERTITYEEWKRREASHGRRGS